MALKSLVGISLEAITPAKETVRRLLDGASRHIADAKVQAVSAETRFGSAYTAVRMLADVGLHAHGYRTLTSKPGHHQTAIQTLPTTFGIDAQTVVRLDKLAMAPDQEGRSFTSAKMFLFRDGAWEQVKEMTMEAHLSMTPSFEYSVPDTPYRFVVMQRMIVPAANETES